MDVRGSLNIDENLSLVTGDGQKSFMENDSFYAKAPPLAASTVGRTKARRNVQVSEMGSFLDDTPVTALRPDDEAKTHGSSSAVEMGARPKVSSTGYRRSEASLGPDSGDQPPGLTTDTDWSVVNDWCRANKQDDMSDQDGKSSLGIINIDDMDLSNNLLPDSPRENLFRYNVNLKGSGLGKGDNSTLKDHGSSNQWNGDGSSYKDQGSSSDSNPWRSGGSSTNNSHDSKPDQPLARSQLGTVKKATSGPIKTDPIVSAIRQSLFAQAAIIGEENEEGDASVYQVELEEQDLHDLDADFEGIDCSVAIDSEGEDSQEKTPTNKDKFSGDKLQLDSLYLKPTGEEMTTSRLPYLSKVSLFDGGSGSEIDTEDELEMARKAQGDRLEAAGEDSDSHTRVTRPGLEGLSLTDESCRQLPITQRQSAEGNVVTSPVPGDGGGGGDGSSGSESDGRSSADIIDRGLPSYQSSQLQDSQDTEEQRIRPMGDDLLSDLRFSRFTSSTSDQNNRDLGLSTRYLTPASPSDNANQPSFNIDDFLSSQTGPLDHDFDPGNRLEASGFNADDVSAMAKGQSSNPFDLKSSSFGSFALNDSKASENTLEEPGLGGDASWANDFREKISMSHQSLRNSGGSDRSLKSNSSRQSGPIDLELRQSLSAGVEAQMEGLRRVPSCGGKSVMNMTVYDEDFFGNADAMAMLDADEDEFEQENILRKDDAMVDTGTPEDSWAYKSIMSVARPSWMAGPEDEEEFCVRISVGTFMRGRTDALGSLSGDGDYKRPDFGMSFVSPPRHTNLPARLIDDDSVFEKTRSSGVGQQDAKTPTPRTASEREEDRTLTMDSLIKTPKPSSPLTVSTLDVEKLGLHNKTTAVVDSTDTTSLSMGEISAMLKASDTTVTDFFDRYDSKARLKGSQFRSAGISKGTSVAVSKATTTTSSSPSKPSQLPVKKGSMLSRSFPKVTDSENSFMKTTSPRQKETSTDSGFKSGSLQDFTKTLTNLEKSAENLQLTSPRSSGSRKLSDDLWSSPNTSTFCPDASDLMKKMNKFKFTDTVGGNQNISEELKERYRIHGGIDRPDHSESLQYDDFAHSDREKTPPPDGQTHRSSKTSLNFGGKSSQVNARADTGTQRVNGISRESSYEKRSQSSKMDWSRLDGTDIDHGYMPGHHIPDGTEYSQRSDYAHINHKGELRENVAGLDDVGLVESRGFDMLNSKNPKLNDLNIEKNNVPKHQMNINTGANMSVNETVGKSKISSHFQPTPSKSPMIGSKSSHPAKPETDIQSQNRTKGRDLKNVETQTKMPRLESGTQTSVVLSERAGIIENEHDHFHQSGHNNVSGIPPQLPISSFKHNLLPSSKTAVSDRLNLLTGQSLMQTEFAQENLSRDFSIQVMDRIYGRNSTMNDNFQTMNATSMESYFHPPSRDSIQSNTDWQYLPGRETLDTIGGDFPRLSEIHPDYSTFKRHAAAQSTPFIHSENMLNKLRGYPGNSLYSQTTLPSHSCSQSQLSTGALSMTDHLSEKSSACTSLCPVKAPGVLKFSEVCCVGISKKEILQLTNPTDRWMECIIEVKSVLIDDKPAPVSSSPFNFRKNKTIIDPGKTEAFQVIFLPKFSGAYVAHVQVFSHLVVKKDYIRKDVIPVNVTLQAIAEDPSVTVGEKLSENNKSGTTIDYGTLVWGASVEKTICIRNNGHATVPLRLAIISNNGWHCFSFESEGRESDASIISGGQPPLPNLGKSIVNLSLPGVNDPFNYREVKVWCRPPDKQCTPALRRQSPDVFSCHINVEVDIPSCKFPKLSSLHLTATVGIRKLHLPTNLKEVQLTCAPNKTQTTAFKVCNAGNLTIDVAFGFSEYKNCFSVTPDALTLNPNELAELNVTFKPSNIPESTLSTILLMYIMPEGPMFELMVSGRVKPEAPQKFKLLCDRRKVNFGGVAIGNTCAKYYQLINKETRSIKLTATTGTETVRLAAEMNKAGRKCLELILPPEEVVPVYVLYSPLSLASVEDRVVMKPSSSTDSMKYTVLVNGYGGVSRVICLDESTSTPRVKGFQCAGVSNFSLGKIKQITLHNVGDRPAKVKVKVFKDFECSEDMLSARIVVQPSEFTIGTSSIKKLDIVVSMTEREFQAQEVALGAGAVLCFSYHDQVDNPKPYTSKLIIGLVRDVQSRDTVSSMQTDVTRTPMLSSKMMRFPLKLNDGPHYTDYNQLSDRSDFSSLASDRSRPDNSSGWCIKPQQLVLYCTSRGSNVELDKFYIYNNNNRDIKFDVGWPGKMLSLSPADGTVKARENIAVRVYQTSQVSSCLDKLPWSGVITVSCGEVMKSVRVEMRKSNVEEMVPEPDDRSLVPLSTNIPHPISGTSNKLGNLLVSRTVVQFPPTKAGQVSEETLDLTNLGSEIFRWMFSSFASPYMKQKDGGSKEVRRVSYKAFDLSKQFGKLTANESIQVTIQFMPKSAGTLSQYWDLQIRDGSKSDHSNTGQDFIRIHFTGEGLKDDEDGLSRDAIDIENLVPRQVRESSRVRLACEVLEFPSAKPRESHTMKVEVKNGSLEDVEVEVTAPSPPFFIKHQRFKILRKRFIKLPVEFRPSRNGTFNDTIRFQASTGENLTLRLVGNCR